MRIDTLDAPRFVRLTPAGKDPDAGGSITAVIRGALEAVEFKAGRVRSAGPPLEFSVSG
ncbi:MAG: hypothetical protein JWM91_4753, partial [Rhodospirillales bacterium]|nr:hypothetical protein [Rhodospirillales bacterium]